MFKIALNNFRGFHKQKFVDVRRLTLLVGENSAGKSSFLAATKFLMDFTGGTSLPSFNTGTFQLGTFDQIAHNRGGGAGRARSFSLSMRFSTSDGKEAKKKPASENLEAILDFYSHESQAFVSSIIIKNDEGSFLTKVADNKLSYEFTVKNGSRYKLNMPDHLSIPTGLDLPFFWASTLMQIRYFVKNTNEGGQESEVPDKVVQMVQLICEQAIDRFRHREGDAEVIAAIRSKPLRTYTPGMEVHDGEGAHVPVAMAKLSRSRNKNSKDAWNKLKKSIDGFGKDSEMFKEIFVKSFGKSASDPFQIQFVSEGPKTNLVDLGYGTSQVIPILYEVAVGSAEDSFLIQQPEVHLHPRAQAALGEYFIQALKNEDKAFILETHSDFIVDRVRKAVADGVLQPEDVSILFFERKKLENSITQIELDKNGEPISAPKAYRAFFMGEQMHMLGL
ncbi:MAG: hypothetical protein COB78_09645 [Hyphomicrobiales bacterium]|nr:MAG: hypothetical protein COB78_09645 [Hyphomicrobiales bacterium]